MTERPADGAGSSAAARRPADGAGSSAAAWRLAESGSSYLRQHAHQPVQWWPWGDAAFAEARRRDVPVLLSVGYASCHWCHVMAHESFEDPDVAAAINDRFVAVKVDREERPDVDAVYMTALQAITGSGGWPMTCFLTTDGSVFHAGTYYPPAPRAGLPGFGQLLDAVDEAWRTNRGELSTSAERITAALRQLGAPAGGAAPPTPQVLAAAAERLVAAGDPRWGGFRGAPKFPPAAACEFLLRHAEQTADQGAADFVATTLAQMARGGINDQLGGGFARYSVDARWHVPHFEKMLDDNAQLLRLYAHHHRRSGDALSARVARETAAFLIGQLQLPGGAFAAALDADTDGQEGLTYLWTFGDLGEVLDSDDASWAAALFTVDASDQPDELRGSVLRLPVDPDDPARFARVRDRLLQARDRRPQPARDEIVVLRSNGLAVAALAEAGSAFGEPAWVDAAGRAADHLRCHLTPQGWRRSSRDGVAGPGPAMLADLAEYAAGLLALHQATGEPDRLDEALAVLARATAEFRTADDGWFDAPVGGGELFLRSRDRYDGATPSGASAMAAALLTAAALTGDGTLRDHAEELIADLTPTIERDPRSATAMAAVARAAAAGPVQIAVAGPAGPVREELLAAARRHAPGGAVVVAGVPDAPGVELLAGRTGPGGEPAVFVCHGFVCDRPVTTAREVAELLGAG